MAGARINRGAATKLPRPVIKAKKGVVSQSKRTIPKKDGKTNMNIQDCNKRHFFKREANENVRFSTTLEWSAVKKMQSHVMQRMPMLFPSLMKVYDSKWLIPLAVLVSDLLTRNH